MLSDCIVSHYKDEEIDDYFCENNCYCTVLAKKVKYLEPRELLIFHLKRFDWSGNAKRVLKKVDFPANDLSVPGMRRKNVVLYKLVSVIYHTGEEVNKGHYFTIMRVGENWMKFNDSTCSAVDPSEVITEQAYILMYGMENKYKEHIES